MCRYVTEVPAFQDVRRGAADHVLEINPAAEAAFIGLDEHFEDREEGQSALRIRGPLGEPAASIDAEPQLLKCRRNVPSV